MSPHPDAPATADTTKQALDRLLDAAVAAAPDWARRSPADRAEVLERVADALDDAGGEMIPLAASESHLPTARVTGELGRTTFQLRMFADALREGSFLEVIVERADPDTPLGPRPDLRRTLIPLGPVAVYAASNFPFAFSVAGGDTASAWAAGCPVVLKAHPGHPRLSRRTAAIISAALAETGVSAGVFGLVEGMDAGVALIQDPRITAGAFTGSVGGGRALFDLAAARPEPIPFYGELGSINPAMVTAAAVRARGPEIAQGYVGSFTLGVGQFCTKPGLLFLPTGHGLEPALLAAVDEVGAAPLLYDGVAARYDEIGTGLTRTPGVRVLKQGAQQGLEASPTLLAVDGDAFRAAAAVLTEECFGPTSILVSYSDIDDLAGLLALVPGSLTATVHAEESDFDRLDPVIRAMTARAGRLVFNGWPTGVAVSWAQQHGGPYPATTAPHTSVGVTAMRRFQRPVTYQGFPAPLLPPALADDNPLGIVRRVDGELGRH